MKMTISRTRDETHEHAVLPEYLSRREADNMTPPQARAYAIARGIIIADTKFEFGLNEATDEVILVDEVLTPDSSRFWPVASYRVGQTPKSFDKQYLRGEKTEMDQKATFTPHPPPPPKLFFLLV